jgi:glutathione S-transferase
MKLYHSSNSPYARKVRVLIIERNLGDKVEVVAVDTSDTNGPLSKINPLGKVPVLETKDDGIVLDSLVICEYLDGYTKSASSPGKVMDIHEKCFIAIGNGMLDVGYAARMESQRPENLKWQTWKDKLFGKINRTLDYLESIAHTIPSEATIGAIGLACALEWLQFRHPDGDWLSHRPKLSKWAVTFGQRPSMVDTRPV